jgi:hypothetical protein
LEFPLESDINVDATLSPGMCALLSLDFLDVELTLDEAILEAMIMYF